MSIGACIWLIRGRVDTQTLQACRDKRKGGELDTERTQNKKSGTAADLSLGERNGWRVGMGVTGDRQIAVAEKWWARQGFRAYVAARFHGGMESG